MFAKLVGPGRNAGAYQFRPGYTIADPIILSMPIKDILRIYIVLLRKGSPVWSQALPTESQSV